MSTLPTNVQQRAFAIVPAAGRSRRMGRAKLLLPWRGSTVIEQVLDAWLSSRVEQVVVVVRGDDRELINRVSRLPVALVVTDVDPEDMKASIRLGIDYLERTARPQANDGCFVAPADIPKLSAAIIDRLVSARAALDDLRWPVVLPYFGEQRGHPALLPWALLAQVPMLGQQQGVNALVDQHAQHAVPFSSTQLIDDIDTLDEYQRLLDEESHLPS